MLVSAANFFRLLPILWLLCSATSLKANAHKGHQAVHLQELSELSIESLRAREYGSSLVLEHQLGSTNGGTEYSDAYDDTGSGPYETYLASYLSDGLHLYTRIDLPNSPPPADGYPVIVFCHGWVGIEAAADFHFSYTPQSIYAELIDGYVDAGFIVLTPGYRGHGTVGTRPADGIEYMAAWDNATYLSPSFYAVDVLNLLDGLGSISNLDFSVFDSRLDAPVQIDPDRIFLSGHSQGGDVVLTVLAAAGENSAVSTRISGASISDGTFADRMTQLEFYSAMQRTRRSFLAGDGSWTGTAIGSDGSINREFVFGFPPDWIETPQPSEWSWQEESWPNIPVATAVTQRLEEMYARLREQVVGLTDAQFFVAVGEHGQFEVEHDPRVEAGMAAIGGFGHPEHLREPLMLHYSDQDYYSPPVWNTELCDRIDAVGGDCRAFLYPHNSHLMRASEHEWFSPPGTTDSYRSIIARDIRFFLALGPEDIAYP